MHVFILSLRGHVSRSLPYDVLSDCIQKDTENAANAQQRLYSHNNNNSNNNNNNSLLFIIYVPSQQPQGQLQTQHSVGTRIIIMIKCNITIIIIQ
jgi:hypothetical protein